MTEQQARVCDSAGNGCTFRRIRLELDEPTRDSERVIYLLTNLPHQAARAKAIARLYSKRSTIERAFQDLEGYLHSDINSLGYPQAALFGFCVALVVYNALAVVFAATLVQLAHKVRLRVFRKLLGVPKSPPRSATIALNNPMYPQRDYSGSRGLNLEHLKRAGTLRLKQEET